MDRRKFLRNAGLSLGSAVVAPRSIQSFTHAAAHPASKTLDTWAKVRSDFALDHSHIQMAQMLLASHPSRVRDAIAGYRKAFDTNPATFWEEKWIEAEQVVTKAASRYMECETGEIALTDSTTQGVALLLNGFKLTSDDEVLSTTHDHYITDESIDYACAKRGASVKRIDEYADPASVTVDEVVSNISNAINNKTRLVVVTWVHSCTGVKLPIRAIAEAIADLNKSRSKRIYFMVDGVHGFGNQAEAVSSLGCDFFAAGTHKWIFGPRGTGIAYARRNAWDFVEPTIPPFREYPYLRWLEVPTEGELTFGDAFTPGGFHAFDHRWALNEAFEYQLDIGRENVHARTTRLNTQLKEGISHIKHIKLHTPLDPALSAGINCFEVEGYSELESVEYLHKKHIIASSSPYRISYARLTPCIINTEAEVDKCLQVLEGMA